MRIVVKTMQGKTYEYEVLELESIESLKQKIAKEHKISIEQIKLIFNGTVLQQNLKKLVEVGIKANDFLVMMISRVST